MKDILHRLYKNSTTLMELFDSQIEGTTLKERLIKAIEEELLESIGEDNNELITKLNNIEDEISNLVVDDTRRAFLKGISYGMFVGMGVITKEREKIPLNKELKIVQIEGLVNGYNKFKNFAGLSSGEVVENTGDMFGLKNCDSDHSINCVVNMFYNSEMSLKDLKEKMSESYFERYLNLSFLESFLSCELSDYSSKLFSEFVNAKKELNNYTLINEYFNGFRIAVNLARECDIFDRESVRENESIMKKVCEEKSQYSKSV